MPALAESPSAIGALGQGLSSALTPIGFRQPGCHCFAPRQSRQIVAQDLDHVVIVPARLACRMRGGRHVLDSA
jgi:hypothetical protein